jgi:Ca-activated chloride channel family protein
MLANDIKPSRIQRVQLKIRDILEQRKEGLTALIAYAGDAHVVVPITDDANTIAAMLPSLRPDIMPKLGSRADLAIELAGQLVADAGLSEASVLLISDGISKKQISAVEDALNSGLRLNLLGVGSKQGGPIPLPQGGFLKDRNDEIVVPQFDAANFQKLANTSNGLFTTLSKDNSDIKKLLSALENDFSERRVIDRDFDTWQDMGAWLVLAILPLALLAFRRGWLIMLVFTTVPLSQQAEADWRDIFLNDNQRGQKALRNGEPGTAAELFSDEEWKAIADYEAGNFERAASRFAENNP